MILDAASGLYVAAAAFLLSPLSTSPYIRPFVLAVFGAEAFAGCQGQCLQLKTRRRQTAYPTLNNNEKDSSSSVKKRDSKRLTGKTIMRQKTPHGQNNEEISGVSSEEQGGDRWRLERKPIQKQTLSLTFSNKGPDSCLLLCKIVRRRTVSSRQKNREVNSVSRTKQ